MIFDKLQCLVRQIERAGEVGCPRLVVDALQRADTAVLTIIHRQPPCALHKDRLPGGVKVGTAEWIS